MLGLEIVGNSWKWITQSAWSRSDYFSRFVSTSVVWLLAMPLGLIGWFWSICLLLAGLCRVCPIRDLLSELAQLGCFPADSCLPGTSMKSHTWYSVDTYHFAVISEGFLSYIKKTINICAYMCIYAKDDNITHLCACNLYFACRWCSAAGWHTTESKNIRKTENFP